jgi:hypothetical protein
MPIRPLALATLSLGLALFAATPAGAGELHDVTAAPSKATAGSKGTGSVTLAAKNGWHLNADAPMTLKLAPGAGVTVDKPKLTRKDAASSTQDQARFDIAFQAADPGAKKIDCEASFVICQDAACKPVKETVTLNIDVTAPKKK